jgi:hypothetical protein
MKLFDRIKLLTSKVKTENGDVAYSTTSNYCVDLYGVINASRNNLGDILNLFIKAYKENSRLALKILMNSRDIKDGAGERKVFRCIFKYLCLNESEVARQLLPFVIDLGRWDDVFEGLKTPVENTVLEIVKTQLDLDLSASKNNGNVSLLSKWMPSVNTSNRETVATAKYLAKKLNMNDATYRKTLSSLRKNRIIENNLREKDYTFNYEHVPSLAMHKYVKAFLRNDQEKYMGYLKDVEAGNKKINVSNLYLYDIIKEFYPNMDEDSRLAMQVKWDNYLRNVNLGNTIVVRDGSASMTVNNGMPMRVATSLAVYFSELLKGEFKNKFITFSSVPRLVELTGESLYDKLLNIYQYDEWTNTDISKVYDLLIEIYRNNKKEIIDRIIIVSDMEFDSGVNCVSTFDTFKAKFDKLKVKMPEVVYWNVNARNVHFATSKEQSNIRFVSGASSKILDSILEGKNMTQKEFVEWSVRKYTFIDEIVL